MNFPSKRVGWLVGTVLFLGAGAVGLACSSTPSSDDDGGNDSSTPDSTTNDGGADTGPDTGTSLPPCPSAPINGAAGSKCDIVEQNCDAGYECDGLKIDAGVYAAVCVKNTSGTIKEGYACQQTTQSNPCVAGLECIAGRCARYCCSGSDQECGTSHPEGFGGKCNLNVTLDGTNTAYTVCTYNKPCAPFEIEQCGPGLTCLVQDSNGTADCFDYTQGGDAGAAEKATCANANDCEDGMGCYGSPDGGSSTCQWNCYTGGGPYDAGIEKLGAGKGGCPGAEKCNAVNWNGQLPMWFGICE